MTVDKPGEAELYMEIDSFFKGGLADIVKTLNRTIRIAPDQQNPDYVYRVAEVTTTVDFLIMMQERWTTFKALNPEVIKQLSE